MRVLTLPKNLDIGGTQLHAVDMAEEMSGRGVEVRVATEHGPLGGRLRSADIAPHPLAPTSFRAARLRTIRDHIRGFRPDVIHAYEVRAILEACLASAGSNTPVLGSILSTRVPWFLPESIPLTVGMPDLAEFTARWRTGEVSVLESPVNPDLPEPLALSSGDDWKHHNKTLVLVSRLVEPFKREAILRTISAMHELGRRGWRLMIVGDGPARVIYETAAEAVNEDVGQGTVYFTGAMLDPGPAIALAHVVVGNGVTVVRAASAQIPTVVVGREGFSRVVSLDSIEALSSHGFYGVGEGLAGTDPLSEQIEDAMNPNRESDVAAVAHALKGQYGRGSIGDKLEKNLIEASTGEPPTRWDLLRALARRQHYQVRRQRLAAKAKALGLQNEIASNYVFGRLRDLALPPAKPFTGANRKAS